MESRKTLDSTDDAISERVARLKQLRQTFTPSRPVQTREIFAGRHRQLADCFAILHQIGLHCILYGERGVGKTSFSNIVQIIADGIEDLNDETEKHTAAIKIECTSSDTFRGIVKQIYGKITLHVQEGKAVGFVTSSEQKIRTSSLLEFVGEKTSFNPKDVAFVFRQLSDRVLIILDEFDRLDHKKFSLSDFTELLKIISDIGADAHFMIVGVGDDVTSIIGNHKSIVRNLSQIRLATMEPGELLQIINKGCEAVGLSIVEIIAEQIVEFSCGYPHYTHLLCLHSGENAVQRGSFSVEQADLEFAISHALSKADETLKTSYLKAVLATRANIYKEVLQACGQAPLDEYGTFQPKDVERPLSAILKRQMKASQFGSHLIKLCEPSRGSILMLIGDKARGRYRFSDPLMRAYVKLKTASRR